MQWIEITVHTTSEGSDLVSDLLVRCGALGTQVMDRKDVDQVKREKKDWELLDQETIDAMPRDVQVKSWFANDGQAKGKQLESELGTLRKQSAGIDLGTLEVESSAVSDDEWVEGWKRYYKPFRIGKRLVIKPTWESYQVREDDLVIEMDPGMAFGTGTHETTNMCMLLLEKYLTEGMHVMDIGTGSGILAIAAAKLGAKEVLAIDVDQDAVKVAGENIIRNNAEKTVTAVKGDMVRGKAIDAELVVANLVAGAITALVEPLKRYLQPGGYIICSGIIKEREQDVLDAFARNDYTVVERIDHGEWVAFCAGREL